MGNKASTAVNNVVNTVVSGATTAINAGVSGATNIVNNPSVLTIVPGVSVVTNFLGLSLTNTPNLPTGTTSLKLLTNKGDTLNESGVLYENEYLISKNGLYCFHVHTDGIARLFTKIANPNSNISTFWSIGKNTTDTRRKYFAAQGDDNLVMYIEGGVVLGSSNTCCNRFNMTRLVLENTRELVAYNSNGARVASWGTPSPLDHSIVNLTNNKGNTLIALPIPPISSVIAPEYNISLNENDYLMSNNGLYCFHVHTDGIARLFTKPTTANTVGDIHFQIGITSTDDVNKNYFTFKREYLNMTTFLSGNKAFNDTITLPSDKIASKIVLDDTRELIVYDTYNNIIWRSNTGILSNLLKDGTTLKCNNSSTQLYRWNYGKLFNYPTDDIALSWDPQWSTYGTYDCGTYISSGVMSKKPLDGDIIKCNDNSNRLYRYSNASNQITYYSELNDSILRQYANYTGTTVWNNTMFQTNDCNQYNPEKLTMDFNTMTQPLPSPDQVTDTSLFKDGSPVKCYVQSFNNIYRYVKSNDSLLHYPNPETANTWDINWPNYYIYNCSRIWDNNSGVNYNLITSKPSNGTIIKCSDDGKYYRYADDTNKLFLYETAAIAKQYSSFQTIQEEELNIATGKMYFAVTPIYDANKLPTYTFYFECCIEKTASGWRNIMNHGIFDYPPNEDGRRPGIYITGNDSAPANRIHIVHSTDKDSNSNMVSNFVATNGQWFTCCFIVNRGTMFTYFNGNKDATISNGSNFNWGSKNKNDWFWNIYGARTDGFIKVRNVRFWNFAMALEWPQTFNPFEITDELNPYSLKPTGNKIVTTILPPPTNCKSFEKNREVFPLTQLITDTTIKDGDTIKCGSGNNQPLYRYNKERNKLLKYTDNKIAQSWDPSYNNYKGYNCDTYLNSVGIMEEKPKDNDVVKCIESCGETDTVCIKNASSYRFINDTNTLEYYMNDNIIKQYKGSDWLITDKLSRNCEQFKQNKPTFIPTQNLSPDTTSLKDGMALKCDNKDTIYRYNGVYDILMEYPDEIIGNSWDPTAFNGYYSYTCDQKYMNTKSKMDLRPEQNTVIKCDSTNDQSQKDNKFYYTYNFDDNSLKPRPSIDSIKNAFPEWNINDIKLNDCRQYSIRIPRFYNGPNGTGDVTNISPENYNGCNSLPYIPTDVLNRSLIRDGESIVLYTDDQCKNMYKNDNGENGRNKSINITYSSTNTYGTVLNESNPSHYKILSDDEYKTLYAIK